MTCVGIPAYSHVRFEIQTKDIYHHRKKASTLFVILLTKIKELNNSINFATGRLENNPHCPDLRTIFNSTPSIIKRLSDSLNLNQSWSVLLRKLFSSFSNTTLNFS